MAIGIVVAGLTTVKVGTGTAGALESLGYSRDGVTIRQDAYTLEVKCDDYGGEAGPGADVQYMGETAHITLELTKWDSAVAAKLFGRLFTEGGGTPGQVGSVGTLFLAGSKNHRVLLLNTNLIRNYPYVILREPIEVNAGTKFSTLRIEGTAWAVSNLLWNTTTTG